jgi:hypothetical protein
VLEGGGGGGGGGGGSGGEKKSVKIIAVEIQVTYTREVNNETRLKHEDVS